MAPTRLNAEHGHKHFCDARAINAAPHAAGSPRPDAARASEISTGLDQFPKFERLGALQHSSDWREYLDIALPQRGVGVLSVTEELVRQIIPNGSAIPKPGFCAFIIAGATSVAALASCAASIASPQRYGLTAFNFLEELSLQWPASMCGIGSLRGVYRSAGLALRAPALSAPAARKPRRTRCWLRYWGSVGNWPANKSLGF